MKWQPDSIENPGVLGPEGRERRNPLLLVGQETLIRKPNCASIGGVLKVLTIFPRRSENGSPVLAF